MEKSLITLKLVLDELGINSTIETIDDRKRVQKAVYLGQLSGLDLGYRFGWYLMGPYCPSLTSDYYALKNSLELDDHEYEQYVLKDTQKAKIQKIKNVFPVPAGCPLSQENWLELVASYHFLRKISNMPDKETRETIAYKKAHVFAYVDLAEEALRTINLL